jgi:hypothetical protein
MFYRLLISEWKPQSGGRSSDPPRMLFMSAHDDRAVAFAIEWMGRRGTAVHLMRGRPTQRWRCSWSSMGQRFLAVAVTASEAILVAIEKSGRMAEFAISLSEAFPEGNGKSESD